MQRCELLRTGRMNITKEQHVFEPVFAPTLVAAASFECSWVFECAKEHVPKRDVREIIGVMAELMMDAMRFGPLENETEPRGSFDIPVIEEFPDCDENGVIARSVNAGAK